MASGLILPTTTSTFTDKSLPTSCAKNTSSTTVRSNAADSTPSSYSRQIDVESKMTGRTEKTDQKSSVTSKSIDQITRTPERIPEITKDLYLESGTSEKVGGRVSGPVDSMRESTNNLVVVFIHDRIVRRAQLPFPHVTSRDTQNILNKLNHSDFKLSRLEKSLITAADLMESQQGPYIDQLVARLPTSDDLPSTLIGIAREVFFGDVPDGVFWARLIAVFVFAGRVAVQCVKTEAGTYVTAIAVSLQNLILDHLRRDIERLGGWDAFVAYCDRGEQRLNVSSSSLSSKGGRLRRFLTQLASVADFDSQFDDPASPQPLTSKVGWFAAPIALGASALFGVFAGDKEF